MAKQLTWFNLSKVENGARVEFVVDWDIFPDCLVPTGTIATIVENNLNEITSEMLVLPDNVRVQRALEHWDGQIILSPFEGGTSQVDENGNDLTWQELSPLAIREGE